MACDYCAFAGQREGICDRCGDLGRHEMMERAPMPVQRKPTFRRPKQRGQRSFGRVYESGVNDFGVGGSAGLALAMSGPALLGQFPYGVNVGEELRAQFPYGVDVGIRKL